MRSAHTRAATVASKALNSAVDEKLRAAIAKLDMQLLYASENAENPETFAITNATLKTVDRRDCALPFSNVCTTLDMRYHAHLYVLRSQRTQNLC